MTHKESALHLAELGLPIFPVIPKSKAPATVNGFKDATLDPKKIEQWWSKKEYSIGVAVPQKVIVVDFDAQSHEHIRDIEDMPLPSTWVTQTPGKGGGRHYWYALPEDVYIPPKVKVMEGMDIRTEGSYVLVPPSLHPDGGQYIWEEEPNCNVALLPPCPKWIVDACITPHYDSIKQKGIDLLEYMKGIPAGARQVGLFRAACYMRHMDIDKSIAELVLDQIAKASEGAGYKKYPDVKKLVKRVWERYEATRDSTQKLWTLDELISADLGEVAWIVDDLLAPGLAIVYADEKVGKSMMVANLALSIATRQKAWGRFVVPKARGVLYLDLEQDTLFGQKRWRKILDGRTPPQNLRVQFEWPRMNEGGLEQMKQVMQANPDIDVVVIDIFSLFQPLTDQPGSNAYHIENAVLDKFKQISKEYNCLFILVHHTNKEGDASGSRAMKSAPDYVFDVQREQQSTIATVSVKGKNIEARQLVFDVDVKKYLWTVVGES